MAAVYKVGNRWRADWTDREGIRHRQRFNTKGDADDHLTTVKGQLKEGMWVAPKKIPTFGALADSWMAGRIEQSRTPGAGYRPSSLAQWQTHIGHMKACFGGDKATEIDGEAMERAIGKLRLSKEQGGRGYRRERLPRCLRLRAGSFSMG